MSCVVSGCRSLLNLKSNVRFHSCKRCLMPGAYTSCKPLSADASSASDEESQLELQLQKQLEEDVARIFDESLYSDLEVVCGKLKILTHSCILKARTNTFYHKLETILHVNIGRSTFDEIYSFISDAYTECNITHQEKEIITYLDDNINIVKSIPKNTVKSKVDIDETEVFLTPKCISPLSEINLQKTISSSPSTELTKEYYALVPIEGNLLDRELKEQDALSNAFQSIIKAQADDLNKIKCSQRNKPTSLSLSSSHTSKTVKHSNSCDILKKCQQKNPTHIENNNENKTYLFTSQDLENNLSETITKLNQTEKNNYSDVDKVIDPAYSPDSLIADEPSSSSDYLSAAYTCSPGTSFSGCPPQLNVGDITKMENVFTSSDSGLENTGLPESLSSHKDVTLTDVSLTETTLHDLTSEDANDSFSASSAEKNLFLKLRLDTSSPTIASDKDFSGEMSSQPTKIKGGKSSKEEKQRQNEEIVILESSSLSSETGSWESVFPHKLPTQKICQQFINNECRHSSGETHNINNNEASDAVEETNIPSLVQKSPFKSTSCFIDAASLMDVEETINVQTDINETSENIKPDMLPAPSRPVPCSTVKLDSSPNEWSESNDNEDSLEQADNKDTDSIQKDLSPTIFEMTPITEDSLCAFENTAQMGESYSSKTLEVNETMLTVEKEAPVLTNTVFVSNTPHNSIMSFKASALKNYDSEESESDSTVVGRENPPNLRKFKKYNESSPIVSGGASIEDHLPLIGCQTASPLTRRKIENIPIVSGAYIPQIDDINHRKSPKICASSWVVDMSSSPKSDAERNASSLINTCHKKPGDRTCDSLKSESRNITFENPNKSRSSVDSDSSEKSSHKFYIDLSSLPDPVVHKSNDCEKTTEKKNIFSMYIDLDDRSTLKEMPARLSSSFSIKKNVETKTVTKSCKTSKLASNLHSAPENSQNSTSIFEKYESLCNNPNISISEIIRFPEEFSTNKSDVKEAHNADIPNFENQFQQETKTITVHDQPLSELTNDLFVKLSDLDKPIPKVNTFLKINEDKVLDVRMTRSIPENNWADQRNSVPSKSIEVISSFHSENALSLNRLFPHLKNEFSRSMPGSLSVRTRSPLRMGISTSPGDIDEQASDMSEISSVQSSICRSVVENSTTEDTSQTSSLIGNCQSRLGQDLLRMFLEEIAPDVIVEVSGRRIKAHKCILSSRCQYFAGILSGGWVESAGNVIVLPPFSFNVVHFALCHIYSGVSTIPDSISIVELATIADMLGLEGLKEAIMFTLKAKYCHHFHRPCAVCTAGVLECFPLSSVYGLDDLYRKCLKWITKYFPKVWPTKAFATLPKELLDKCYQQLIVNLTIENFVDTIYGCGITVASLQNSRWAESVARMCRRLTNAAAHYAAPRLVAILRTVAPLPSDPPHFAKEALSNCLSMAIDWAPPDEACRAYAYLSDLVKEIRTQHYSKPDLITNGNQSKATNLNNLLYAHASNWRQKCEAALVRAAPRVVGTHAFKELPADLRKRLREMGCIMYATQGVPVAPVPLPDRKTKSSYTSKSTRSVNSLTTRSLDIDHMRASFVPYAAKPAAVNSVDVLKSNNDLRDRKTTRVNPPKIRTTKAQEERAKYNLKKNTSSQDRFNSKLTTARCSYENTKPRYLDPKASNKESDKKMSVGKKLVAKMVSSSESSRNSSPIQARNLRVSRMRTRQAAETKAQAISQDSLATSSRPRTAEPSTDSLSESQNSNKYATYTKTKHTNKGSVESIKSSKCVATAQNTKLKTKIPVYLNQPNKPNNTDLRSTKEITKGSVVYKKSCSADKATIIQPRKNERKVPGSLMNATKSSSAKMVLKITKGPLSTSTPKPKRMIHTSTHQDHEKSPDITIPIMERSGTFLMDEPTFVDITTDIDLDQ